MPVRFLALPCLLCVTSCMLPPNVAILIPDEGGTIGKAQISNPGGTVALDKPFSTVGAPSGKGLDKPFFANEAQVEQEFAGVLSATPRPPVTFVLYFLPDQAVLAPESIAELQAVIARAKSTPNKDISVVGHADSTGSEDANIKISLARATTIRESLVGAGVSASVIEITSHGSKNPRVPATPNVPEPLNRRVEVTIR